MERSMYRVVWREVTMVTWTVTLAKHVQSHFGRIHSPFLLLSALSASPRFPALLYIFSAWLLTPYMPLNQKTSTYNHQS